MSNQPAYPSSSRPINHRDNDEVSFLEFIRTAGGTVPAQPQRTGSSTSIDRKRRHAGSSPERRGYPYPACTNQSLTGRRPSGMSMAGGSRDNVIDLTSPSPPPGQHHRPYMPQRAGSSTESIRAAREAMRGRDQAPIGGSLRAPSRSSGGRRDSDFVLPRWQPDSEVSHCPVCQTPFHFFYRKHHCRKCGRVVCAACSPHRITIPRQYIVQPPTGSDSEDAAPLSPSGGGTLFARNLGGGEIVRVCNPCVPDPWTPEAAASSAADPRIRTEQRRRDLLEQLFAQQPGPPRTTMPPPPPPPPPRDDSLGRARAHSHQPLSYISRSMPPQAGSSAQPFTRQPLHPTTLPPFPGQVTTHRHTQSSSSTAPLPPLPSSLPPMPSAPSAPPQPKQRREVREEDECPVCGAELPPGDAIREAHVQECIASRFSAGTPASPSLHGLPQTAGSTQPTPSGPERTRPRATSYRPRGMAVYRATEKDCTNEDGEPQECVICFEEFQPGDEMGRMECLCKFHRVCIRRWWETKGGGSCPTHQLHE